MILSAIASNTAHPQTAGNGGWATAVLVSVLLLWPALSVWFLRRHDDPDDSGGDGGSGGPPPEPPPPDGPAWWPEFEREFAAHVSAIARTGADPPQVPSSATVSRAGRDRVALLAPRSGSSKRGP